MAISLDKATLAAALVGYQQQLQQIETKMAEIRRILNGSGAPAKRQPSAAPAKQKHHMSAEGRARIAAAQRARWAKVKGE
ncbi:MAG: hypothetical protein ABI759_27570 [Candidatus Solibacter sp.]